MHARLRVVNPSPAHKSNCFTFVLTAPVYIFVERKQVDKLHQQRAVTVSLIYPLQRRLLQATLSR
jgi:hypothetical protein